MKQVVISFDIDDVLVNNTAIEDTLNYHGYGDVERKWKIEDMDIPEYVVTHIIENFTNPEIACNFKHNPNCQKVVAELSAIPNVKIVVITARPEDKVGDGTRDMISRHFPEIKVEDIHFTNGDSKRHKVKELNVSMHIDDSSGVIIDLMKEPVNLVVMSNESTPHNHEFVSNHDGVGITIVNDVIEVLLLVEKMIK